LVHTWYGKIRKAGLQSGEGHTMMDSVVWTQYINVTDSHVTLANAAPTHWHQAAMVTQNVMMGV